jgi:hypothetical protein
MRLVMRLSCQDSPVSPKRRVSAASESAGREFGPEGAASGSATTQIPATHVDASGYRRAEREFGHPYSSG